MSTSDTITIKIKRGTHTQLRTLIERLAVDGWGSIGLERTDVPTFATVIEAAVGKLTPDKASAKKIK